MDDVVGSVERAGGFSTSRQLKAQGFSDRSLTLAVRTQQIARVRNGHYSTRSVDDPAFRAVRVGGRLTGLSALAAMGCWIWRAPARLHVAVPAHSSRLRLPSI